MIMFGIVMVFVFLAVFVSVRSDKGSSRRKVVDGYVSYDTSGVAGSDHGCGHYGGHDAGGHGGDCGSGH